MKVISILTSHLFNLNSDGPYVIPGGGLERYIWELCETIQEIGMKVTVHQLTPLGSFHKQIRNIEIIGHQVKEEERVNKIMQMSDTIDGLIVYAGIEKLGPAFPYQIGSIGISYGMSFAQGSVVDCSLEEELKHTTYDRLQQIVVVSTLALGGIRCYQHSNERTQGIVIRQSVDILKFKPVLHWSELRNALRIVFPRALDQGREVVNTLLLIDRILQAYPEVIVEFANDSEEENAYTHAFRLWLKDHPYKERIVNEKYTFRKMVEAYRKANIVVIPSFVKEGSAYSCLEAMSCGIPVIAGNRGGINDFIVDGYNGVLVDPFEDPLFNGISRLLDHADVRRYLGSNARRTASAFDKNVWKRQWMKLFQSMSDVDIGSKEQRPAD
ncbi:glycosyltransferase family 4 protein [Paenibacillus macquariensis]|uniref:Glycosyltransferase involved in cell wall bisynthesis n=1 Tax=Paenibacillus macquariensis TaxID=948756 RepID=A0ABY1KBH8_9BACL|nr:glycosyltransferase family 4 protein [Paenibacillus macquariensis]MEC0094285.1 glycosyltransferase family 4 protein [Paenibacillus macquariensis]OAB32175.1 hypothetical protein PMSM_18130 [Paenibacillus macquariensis subsp. macquariensis]SIR55671.1 Glycosyltransferase involved in cell wall bisynthesis [Paenibacillus macquariensis]